MGSNYAEKHLHEPISLDFIRQLHFIATHNVKGKGPSALGYGVMSGQFRTQDVMFNLTSGNSTKLGIGMTKEISNRDSNGRLLNKNATRDLHIKSESLQYNMGRHKEPHILTNNSTSNILRQIKAGDEHIYMFIAVSTKLKIN